MSTEASPPPLLADAKDAVYTLVASRCLPYIDPTKTVKQVVLSKRLLPRFNRWVRRWRYALSLGYWLGVALGTGTLFLPARIGVWLAVVSMPLQLVPSVVSVMVLRYDMAVLVVRGYEFWYLTLSNVAVSALISFSFHDARFLVMVGASVAFETALLLDANRRASQLVSLATVLGALTNVAYLTCATLGVIEYGRDLALVRYKHRVLYADDATANLIATLVVLLLRNGVRKLSLEETSDKRTAYCITYRCQLALALVSQRQASLLTSSAPPPCSRSNTVARQLIPLEHIADGQRFRSVDMVLPHWLHLLIPSVLVQVSGQLLHVASFVSLISWIVTAVSVDPAIVQVAATASLTGASVVFVSYLALVQRQLLWRLFVSFDFLFLSVQFTLAHLCLADIVHWSSPRALAVLASWLWTHWVLLLDAVLPIHKSTRYLHFRPCVACAVLLLFVLEQLVVSVAIVFYDDPDDPRFDLQDRVILTLPLRGRVKQLRVVPLLFGRMVATLSWSLRLLWRLRTRVENECLLLQGRVQYDNTTAFSTMASAEWPRKDSAMTQVVPIQTRPDAH